MESLRSGAGRIAAVVGLCLTALLGFGITASPAGAGAGTGDCAAYLGNVDLYLVLLGGPQATMNPLEVKPGDTVTISLTGWQPGSTVDVVVVDAANTSHTVGTVTIGDDSTAQTTWNVPATAAIGPATLQATGTGCTLVLTTVEVAFNIVSVISDSTTTTVTGELPVTGSNSSTLVGIGAALLVTGAAAVYGARRQRTTD